MLTREQIISARKRVKEQVEIEGYGSFIVSVMSGSEYASWLDTVDEMRATPSRRKQYDAMLSLLTRCLINENGERLFKDEEIALLTEIDKPVLDTLTEAAMRVNKLTDQERENARGNSEPGRGDGRS